MARPVPPPAVAITRRKIRIPQTTPTVPPTPGKDLTDHDGTRRDHPHRHPEHQPHTHGGQLHPQPAHPPTTDGRGVSTMTRTSPSVDQAIYDALYTTLRRVLRTGVHAGAGAEEGLDSFLCRVVGALYALLMDHPIDRNGRCRSCRRPGSVLGRHRQDCGVYEEVSYWLGEPEKHLRERMAYQWGLTRQPA
jgi:hypothetical protein